MPGPKGMNKKMCIKAVEAQRVIEPGHNNWMSPYVMVSISLKAAARNESGIEKDFFELMNNRVFGRTMENIRRMPCS